MLPLALITITSCDSVKLGPVEISEDYFAETEEFYETRRASLTAPTGWMRLSAMMWLSEGENTFGSHQNNDIVFPEGSIPGFAGTFILSDGIVNMIVNENVEILSDGEPVKETTIFDENNDIVPRITHSQLEWFIIRRDDLIGVRLYNKDNPVADAFTGFPRYEVNPDYYVHGKLIPHSRPTTVNVINVLGQEGEVESPGVVEFELLGERHRLIALQGTNRMFMIFADPTNRTETYQAGRYMYIDYPTDRSGATKLDFNRAYNPPCAFSEFTTCQLPPEGNYLSLAIEAGEKRP